MPSSKWVPVLRERLSLRRLEHSLRVAENAEWLATRWNLDSQKCYLAGLLHDIARDYPPEELLRLAWAYGIVWAELEANFPVLLHGSVGAEIIKRDLGLTDPELLEAVRLHTTGDYPLSPTARVLFLADYIEPGRNFPGVTKARQAAELSLDHGVAVATQQILAHLLTVGQAIDPKTINLYNYYVNKGFYR